MIIFEILLKISAFFFCVLLLIGRNYMGNPMNPQVNHVAFGAGGKSYRNYISAYMCRCLVYISLHVCNAFCIPYFPFLLIY